MYINGNKPMAAVPTSKGFRAKACKRRDCKESFTPSAPSQLYCSQGCADRGYEDRYLLRLYGMTMDDYKGRLESQGGVCAICKGPGFKMKDHHNLLLVVDHCHTTGKVRGLLCHNCNRALGLFKDSKGSLGAAIEYLTTPT